MVFFLTKFVFLLQVLFCFSFYGVKSGLAQSQLPIPKSPEDPRYLEKDPAKREAFFKDQEILFTRLKKEIESLKAQNPEEEKTLKEAEELLSSLPFLWRKLRLEFEQKTLTELTLPTPKNRPPSLSDFREILLFGFQLRHEIEALKRKQQLEKEDLDRLENALKEVYRAYLVLAPQKTPKAYLKLAELLNLQVRFALAKLELAHTTKRLEYLVSQRENWKQTLKKTFTTLKIRPQEISNLAKALQKEKKTLEALKEKDRKLRAEIERNLALIEIRLTKLGSTNPFKRKYYETKKEILQTKLALLELNEDLAALKLTEVRLWHDFATCLAKSSRKNAAQILNKYDENLKKFQTEKETLKYRLNYFQEKIISVKTYLNLHQSKSKKGYFLNLLIAEEKNFLSILEELQEKLEKKYEVLRTFIFEGINLITLWKENINFWQRIYNQIRTFYQNSGKTVKAILYYPLWKTGGTTFTVLSFLKVIFVLTVGIILLKLIRRRIERFLVKHLGMAPGVVNSLSTLSYYLMICLLALVALSTAGINMSQIALIFGALSVGIGFGLQTIANNFVSGIILLTERSIKVGDLVQFEDGTIGVVEKINIRSTVIRTFDALEIIVPNSEFIAQRISTWTYEDDWRRILIPFGVAYGTDPEKVREVATKAARSVPITREDPDHPIRVRFVGFGESSLDFELAVWIRQSEVNRAMTGIKSDYYYALYKALNEAGIEIPFPQRDIHLRSIYPEALARLKEIAVGGGDHKK